MTSTAVIDPRERKWSRADERRNRERLMVAAWEALAVVGASVRPDGVARRAMVRTGPETAG